MIILKFFYLLNTIIFFLCQYNKFDLLYKYNNKFNILPNIYIFGNVNLTSKPNIYSWLFSRLQTYLLRIEKIRHLKSIRFSITITRNWPNIRKFNHISITRQRQNSLYHFVNFEKIRQLRKRYPLFCMPFKIIVTKNSLSLNNFE